MFVDIHAAMALMCRAIIVPRLTIPATITIVLSGIIILIPELMEQNQEMVTVQQDHIVPHQIIRLIINLLPIIHHLIILPVTQLTTHVFLFPGIDMQLLLTGVIKAEDEMLPPPFI